MTFLQKILAIAGLSLTLAVPVARAQSESVTAGVASEATNQVPVQHLCEGKTFNPMTDMDWNNMYPITIAGAIIGLNNGPPVPSMASMPAVCVCPTWFGFSFVGIGVTFWQPQYIYEIERRPGCSTSVGGAQVLSGYGLLHSEQSENHINEGKGANRMQIHFYNYPAFQMVDAMKAVYCHSMSGAGLVYMTEFDNFWQNPWGGILSPESALFASTVAAYSCAIDAVASSLGYTLDPMFWCQGHWGTIYPMTGTSSHSGNPFAMNNSLAVKFLARQHRLGLQMMTVGPLAVCSAVPSPIIVKSQYRFDQVGPIPRSGKAVAVGSSGILQFPPITNVPTQEHTTNMIWQGQQCCLKAIP